MLSRVAVLSKWATNLIRCPPEQWDGRRYLKDGVVQSCSTHAYDLQSHATLPIRKGINDK
jgi:hypothetical protein